VLVIGPGILLELLALEELLEPPPPPPPGELTQDAASAIKDEKTMTDISFNKTFFITTPLNL
jgi:hypothetical protein